MARYPGFSLSAEALPHHLNLHLTVKNFLFAKGTTKTAMAMDLVMGQQAEIIELVKFIFPLP
jgi:hypothetical protein